MSVKIFVVLMSFIVSTYLFYKASGTLNPTKLNLVSYIYYLFMLTCFIGGSLIFIGFRDHYMIKSMLMDKGSINTTFLFIVYTAIVMPLCAYLVLRIMKINPRERYGEVMSGDTEVKNERAAFLLISVAAMICILLTVYMFTKMKTVPLINLVLRRTGDIGTMRHDIVSTNYINPYVKNLFVLTLTPLLSYFTFIYWRATKDKKWFLLFVMLFISSIFIKTYDYSKSPVVFYLVIFMIIHILMKGKISKKVILGAGIGLVGIILFMYARGGYSLKKMFDIYNGPLGRTIFTSVGTLFLHFDLFPGTLPLLAGRSLSPTILGFMNDGLAHVRSGRVVMEFYSPFRVNAGTAGVMNSMYVGEAYANFGHIGALLAPIYVGILIGLAFAVILKLRKEPDNLMIYIALVVFFTTVLNGGFSDFIYNFNMIFILCGILVFKVCSKYLSRIYEK